jgi:hypothetical protein
MGAGWAKGKRLEPAALSSATMPFPPILDHAGWSRRWIHARSRQAGGGVSQQGRAWEPHSEAPCGARSSELRGHNARRSLSDPLRFWGTAGCDGGME